MAIDHVLGGPGLTPRPGQGLWSWSSESTPEPQVTRLTWSWRGERRWAMLAWVHADHLGQRLIDAGTTAEEKARASQFARADKRRERLASAWLVRQIVGRATGVRALDVIVDRRCPQCSGDHGRPRATTSAAGTPLRLSVTHSGGLVGVALSDSAEVGLDVEDVVGRSLLAWRRISRRLSETDDVRDDSEQEASSIARRWVRAESVLKAVGVGLAVRPRAIKISGDHCASVSSWPWTTSPQTAELIDLGDARPYVAALTMLNEPVDVREFVRTTPWCTTEVTDGR